MPAPSPLAFWARRQAHETAIHHADAQSAGAAVPVYAPGFAADGIDELIMGFGRRRKYQPAAGVDGGRLHVAAADTGDVWLIDAREGRMQPRRKDAEDDAADGAACTVRGPASGVYLYLWNRADAARPVSPSRATPASWPAGRPASGSAGADQGVRQKCRGLVVSAGRVQARLRPAQPDEGLAGTVTPGCGQVSPRSLACLVGLLAEPSPRGGRPLPVGSAGGGRGLVKGRWGRWRSSLR